GRAVESDDDHAVSERALALEYTRGRTDLAIEASVQSAGLEALVLLDHAEAAPKSSRASRVLSQSVPSEAHRVPRLQYLDGDYADLAEKHRVLSVFERLGSPPAAFRVGEHAIAALAIPEDDVGRRAAPVLLGVDSLGDRVGERALDRILERLQREES